MKQEQDRIIKITFNEWDSQRTRANAAVRALGYATLSEFIREKLREAIKNANLKTSEK